MNRIGIPVSERQELLSYLKKTYRYEDGGIVNRKTGTRRRAGITTNGYLNIVIGFKGTYYNINVHRFVWVLCNGSWPQLTIDHINGNRHDNRIENLREVTPSENTLNKLLTWEPNKDTGVTGVAVKERGYQSKIQGRNFHFSNPYEAFYWGIACGKRYRAS